MVKHTPTPWFAQGVVVGGDDGKIVFSGLSSNVSNEIPLDVRRQNAAIAVSAVNAFAALAEHLNCDDLEIDLVAWYEALKGLVDTLEADSPITDDLPDTDSVGWDGEGKELLMTFGHIRRARAIIKTTGGENE